MEVELTTVRQEKLIQSRDYRRLWPKFFAQTESIYMFK